MIDVKHVKNDFGQAQANKFKHLWNGRPKLSNLLCKIEEQFKRLVILMYGQSVHYLRIHLSI